MRNVHEGEIQDMETTAREMKKAALYIRVSTQEQAQEGYSVGEQKDRLIAYCKAHDWLVSELYVDAGYTGSNLKRPGMQKLIAETGKFDVVLVYKLDRLSRSQRDTLYLIEEVFLPNDVDFVSMQESFDTSSPLGKAMIGFLAVFAQLEREQIKERTKMGRVARAKQGLYKGGGQVPIGYEYKDGHLYVNPYEAEIVRLAFKWYLNGETLKTIAERLTEKGYKTRTGKERRWSGIRAILGNEVYIGTMKYGDVVLEDAHEAIISKEDFKAVQELREKKSVNYKDSFKAKHLLAGLVYCGYCGARYYHRSVGKGDRYSYYGCYSRTKQIPHMIKDPNCDNRIWKQDELESLVEEKVREVLRSPELAREISEQKAKPVPEKNDDAARKRIAEIDRQIAKLMVLYQQDEMPAELLSENISRLYNEKNGLSETLTPSVEDPERPFDLVQELIKDAAKVWDFADTAQKRRILQSLIKRITLTGENVNIEWAF